MVESLFGIEIVKSDDGDISEEGICLFNVMFLLDSLKKYNEMSILINQNWDIIIYEDNGDIKEKFNIIDNDEFKNLLKERLSV